MCNDCMKTLHTAKKGPSRTPRAPQDWHPADIKAALEKAGYTLRRLSLQDGRSGAYYSQALHRPNPRAEARLAEVISLHTPVTAQQIWPSRYEPCGAPRRGLYIGTENGRRYKELSTTRSVGGRNGRVTVNREWARLHHEEREIAERRKALEANLRRTRS